ncbi:TonB-dependent receptor plug domain-containing protein [Pseudocolwellia agarivorans]|uniref:TonB-dependent receptor plug domain-containing protein n=1 Tax=Pseudocolwellia agarivorans TaxID=1911682 RepID=UPI000986CEEA|nr:TonB-dependent receptor plug domain-containing protein [Pseudocolwellia agarivorans]
MQYKVNKIALAVALAASTSFAIAQESEDSAIEEVVVKASRLQGSAVAVVEERKNQAFVADILGAEQLSKTGDSDAASALRRVTGLTLVDGKFIYVRGLGERYSSARLNGASVPSPDLTRNVIPLDLFPSSIIESLAVQKAYSPSMPAAFGGGAIDIRTKSIPSEFVANFEVGIGKNSEADKGLTYNGNDSGLSSSLRDAIVKYRGNFGLASIITKEQGLGNDINADQAEVINQNLLSELNRDMSLKRESLDPSTNFKASLGNSFDEDFFGGTIGFLASAAYDNKWKHAEKTNNVITQDVNANCSESLNSNEAVGNSCFDATTDSEVTTEEERINGVFTLGYKLGQHKVSYSKIYLKDSEDETEMSVKQAPGGSTVRTIFGTGSADRIVSFNYEERELDVDQFVGQHTFNDYWGLGFDWQYTESEANTEIPTEVEYIFRDNYNSNTGEYVKSNITGDQNRASYSFVDMQEHVKSASGNLTLPVYSGDFEMEYKVGYDLTDKSRNYVTSSFKVNNNSGAGVEIGNDPLLISSYLTDQFITENSMGITFNEPSIPDADDYIAAQKIDAAYGAFDVIYKNTWRFSGGIRYEQFRQVSLRSSSLVFSKDDVERLYDEETILEGTINEDDFYPSLSMTYLGSEDYQIRFGYGETVVRPDLREVIPVAYYDPLTDIRTSGRVGLASSNLKNYDLRYENYSNNGDNWSVALFYKDIDAPIENILRIGDEDYSLSFINGEEGEVYGIETEWLHDLSYLADGFFTSGNITLSESEVSVNPALAGNLTNPTKRLTGHSEYVVNLQLNYDSANGNHSSSLVYNVFGERIIASGVAGREDAFEQPFHSLDAVYTYYPDFNSKVKFKVQNILGEDQEVIQSDIVVRSKDVGVSIGLSYTYEFE